MARQEGSNGKGENTSAAKIAHILIHAAHPNSAMEFTAKVSGAARGYAFRSMDMV
jgi:hypothetical protein